MFNHLKKISLKKNFIFIFKVSMKGINILLFLLLEG